MVVGKMYVSSKLQAGYPVAIQPVVSNGGIKGRRPSKKDKRRACAALTREDNPSDCGNADLPKSGT
jgi:hypothetical protein